jgi:hypothetical protein
VSSRAFYDAVADALRNFLPPSLRGFESYRTAHNIKLWFGDERREHYEVQHIRRGRGHALEIGFHAEHPSADANDDVIDRLTKRERTWRKTLGKTVEVGPFIGAQDGWRRISELWDGPIDNDPAIAFEAAERLAQYVQTLEPLRNRVTK